MTITNISLKADAQNCLHLKKNIEGTFILKVQRTSVLIAELSLGGIFTSHEDKGQMPTEFLKICYQDS